MSETFIKNIIDDSSTGKTYSQSHTLKYKFEKYEINVALDEFQKFLGITEVKINKDFLESHHKRASKFDVSQYYED